MASMAKIVALMILAFVAISMLESAQVSAATYTTKPYYGPGSVKPSQCYGRCLTRCSQTSHKKPCMFFCQYCCKTCQCVPPGFYGNKAVCPCYNNWKTQEGRPKCP